MYLKSIIIFMLLNIIPVGEMLAQEENERDNFGVTLGLGFVDGSDYSTLIKRFWTAKGYQVTKAGTFIDLEGGLEFRVVDQFFLNPRLRWLLSIMERKLVWSTSFTESKGYEVNTVLMPGVSAKYFIRLTGPHFLYINAFGGWVKPFSAQDELSFSADGLEKGFAFGYQHVSDGNAWGIEMGYTTIPVKVTDNTYATYGYIQNLSGNFGGLEITLSFFF